MADDALPFRADDSALIRFGDAGRAPVLSYDVPQPAEYNGRHFLELLLADDVWSAAARPKPAPLPTAPTAPATPPTRPAPPTVTPPTVGPDRPTTGSGPAGSGKFQRPLLGSINAVLADAVAKVPKGRAAPADGPLLGGILAVRPRPEASADGPAAPRPAHLRRLDALVARLGEEQVVAEIRNGARLVERRTLDNRICYDLVPPPDPALARPRLAIVHVCRLSSFLGEYGAGRTISTFSLLPGERHEIEIKTYKRSKRTASEASSILDSFEETRAEEFQSDLSSENTSQNTETENFNYQAEAEASATWGWGQATASGGVAGGTTGQREEFAKNVASTTQKHAATAAAKRQVEVNTSTTSEVEEGEETTVKRTIENINVGRTLNFVFRQMNQVFLTVLHVVDVRIAFRNGDPAMEREFALPELTRLLDELVAPAARKTVSEAIWQALTACFDWRGDHRPLVEAVKLAAKPNGGAMSVAVAPDRNAADYWRFRRQATTLDALADGAAVTVPGVVLGVTRSTLPTDGVVVDALLGQGNALDAYSMGLQVQAVAEKQAQNARLQAETEALQLKLQAVRDKDKERAALIAQVFPPPPPAARE